MMAGRLHGGTTMTWLSADSWVARIGKGTALLVAFAALVNGGADVLKAVRAVPVGRSEATNEQKFKEHFGRLPLLEQPVVLNDRDVTITMLLQVYENGDLLVRYNDFHQWLPFRRPPDARLAGWIRAAHAQPAAVPEGPARAASSTLPHHRTRPTITIDLAAARRANAQVAPDTGALTTEHVLSDIQYTRSGLSKSTQTYTKTFPAAPGFRIVNFDVQEASTSNAHIRRAEIVDGGNAVRVEYQMTSGPIYDQYRGWIHATITLKQAATAD